MSGERDVPINGAQAVALGHLSALMGPGELRPDSSEHLAWVWYRTKRHDWCIDEKGHLRGWNDLASQPPTEGETETDA